jgi:hypothetical protein
MASPSSLTERKSGYFHSLSKAITNETQYPFESKFKSSHTIKYDEVWAESIPYCPDVASADAFAFNSSVIKKYELKELTEIPGSNGQAWYINDTKFVRPFISPVDVVEEGSNMPSIGFDAKLYKENETFISSTSGVWFIDYYAGIVHFESGYTPNDLGYGIPKISLYVYIGKTVADLINSVMNNQSSLSILTTEKLLISNNKITLNYKCKGDVIYNKALIYNDLNSEYFIEYTCNSSIDGEFIEFNYNDNLNGKYAVVSYLAGEII